MFTKLKMKLAARRVERNKRARRNRRNRRPGFWARVWNVICWPFRIIWRLICWIWRLICRFVRWLWRLICSINVIGLLNIALLVAIIVLCSMLIIDIINCTRKPTVIVADPIPVSAINEKIGVPVVAEPVSKPVTTTVANASMHKPLPRTDTLPIKRAKSHKMRAEPIRVVKSAPDTIAEKQTAKVNNKMYGDIIIDSRGAAKMLNNGSEITGNLYLQNLRKYVLPCDVKITGNLFVRDVNMLQFCGDFEITGNIYVSPRSSFGPIPRSARLGGQVIL